LTIRGTTSFLALLPVNYSCLTPCEIYINNAMVHRNTGDGHFVLLNLNLVLGTDRLSVHIARLEDFAMPYFLPDVWTPYTDGVFTFLPPNTVVTFVQLSIKRLPGPYADPKETDILPRTLNFPSTQSYTFFVPDLEPAVDYQIELLMATATGLAPFFYTTVITTDPGLPTGPVVNLVKYFLGLTLADQDLQEQGNLQVHWDAPLSWLQHGVIQYYQITYCRDERTYITYGPAVSSVTVPLEERVIQVNASVFTVTLLDLVPDSNYTVTVYPATAVGLGPGTSLFLATRVAAPPKPPVPVLIARNELNVSIGWSSLTNETGLITKVWLLVEPYIGTFSAEVIHLDSTLPALPVPFDGVQGFFAPYNLSAPCSSLLFGFTFASRSTGNICGGFCSTPCELGTPLLDPNVAFATNNQTLFNDNYLMDFNTSTRGPGTRHVHYLTMKKRFPLGLSQGGLNLSGKFVVGDGRISSTNNTRLDPRLNYRIRFVVFTSESLYAISDALVIPPFPLPSQIDLMSAVYIGLGVALGVLLLLLLIFQCVKRRLMRYADLKQNLDAQAVLSTSTLSTSALSAVSGSASYMDPSAPPLLPPKRGKASASVYMDPSIPDTGKASASTYMDPSAPVHPNEITYEDTNYPVDLATSEIFAVPSELFFREKA
jgi:hypothetical protein